MDSITQFPIDILREISLFLPHYYLSLSKQLDEIYNESWFKYKVLSKHPKCKVDKFSWKDLYKRSLKQGQIFSYIENEENVALPIEGIKVSYLEYNLMVLTFDGDLWSCGRYNQQKVLIDVSVTDICFNSYIKGNELYINSSKYNISKRIEAKNDFISIRNNNDITISAITKDKLYDYDINSNKINIINCNNNKCFSFTKGSNQYILQDYDGTIKICNYLNILINYENKLINEVINIYSGSALLSNGKLIKINTSWDGKLTTKVLLNNCKGLQKVCFTHDGERFIILINGNIYNRKKQLIVENVKNIFEHYKIDLHSKLAFTYIK